MRIGLCHRFLFAALLSAAVPQASRAEAQRIWLVKDGKPAADVFAGAPEWGVAEKLISRIEQWTGARLMLFGPSQPLESRKELARLLIGTSGSNPEIARLVGTDPAYSRLNDQGYALRATVSRPMIVVAGKTPVAALYGVGELLNYRLEVEKGNVWCEPFELVEQPALPYRWFWLSTSYAHWDATYGGPHVTDETARTYGLHPDGTDIAPAKCPGQMLGPVAYLNTYKAMVDWMSEHKLNGALIFGYLNSGVDLGREVAAYGRDRGVDILAGVGTMGYWGAYYGGVNEFNLDTFMKLRPELTRTNARGAATVCPSLPAMQEYWRSAGRWIAQALPELGGLYLEHGDLGTCPCDVCKAKRAEESNDTGCYWDMMASETPVIEGAAAVKPKWKYVYAAYTSFTPEALKAGTSRVPPRFPAQFPPYAICQWTVTGMDEKSWPEGLKAPTRHSVGLFHSPSVWGAPDGSDRWWAGPGSSHDDASRLVRLYCNRMASSGFEGLVVKGMKNHHSPGPLLTYLALEEFSWHPQLSMDRWERDRLGRLVGGPERSALYLRIARDSSRDLAVRRKLVDDAQSVVNDPKLSPRALPYWQDLAEEMRYRVRLIEVLTARQKEKEKPKAQTPR
jgi:hypothetical protein